MDALAGQANFPHVHQKMAGFVEMRWPKNQSSLRVDLRQFSLPKIPFHEKNFRQNEGRPVAFKNNPSPPCPLNK